MRVLAALLLAFTFSIANAGTTTLPAPPSSSAPAGFETFLFTVLGDCAHTENPEAFFRTTTTIEYPIFGQDRFKRNLVMYMKLNLLTDNTYFAEYGEDVLVTTSGSVTELQSVYFVQLAGSWHIENDRMILGNLGEGTVVGGSTFPKLELTIRSIIHDERVLGLKTKLALSTSDTGPHGETAVDYCAIHPPILLLR